MRRIIPTRVGNACAFRAAYPQIPDHPHTRGERNVAGVQVFGVIGSSPHAWGTLRVFVTLEALHRIIPTRVGNAKSHWVVPADSSDHPHTRGERMPSRISLTSENGSSPHAWGTQARPPHFLEPDRIIPTRVGNAEARLRLSEMAGDHPHTRGERGVSPDHAAAGSGSSPHAWGTHTGPCRMFDFERIIPTRVGNAIWRITCLHASSDHPHTRGERTSSNLLIQLNLTILKNATTFLT